MLRKLCCSILPSCCEAHKSSLDDETLTPFFSKNNVDNVQSFNQSIKKTSDPLNFHTYDAHFHSLQQMRIGVTNVSTTTCSAVDTPGQKYSFQKLPVNQLFLLEKSPFRIICLVRHHFKETEENKPKVISGGSAPVKMNNNQAFQSCIGPNDLKLSSRSQKLSALHSSKVKNHVAKKFRDKTVLLINLFCSATEFIYEIVRESCLTICLLDRLSSPFYDIPKDECPQNIEFIYHRGLNFILDSQLVRKGYYDVAIIDLMFRLQKEIYEKIDDELQIKEEGKIRLSQEIQYLVKKDCTGIMLLLPPNLKLQDFAEIFYNVWFDGDWAEEPPHYCLEFEVYYAKGEPECIIGYYGKLSKVSKSDQINFIAMKIYRDFLKNTDLKALPDKPIQCLEKIVSKAGLRKTLNILSCSHIRESAESSLKGSQHLDSLLSSEKKLKQKFVSFIDELAQEGCINEGLLNQVIDNFPIYKNELIMINIPKSDKYDKQSVVSKAKQSHTSHGSPDTLTFNDLEVWKSSPNETDGKQENSDLKPITKSEISPFEKSSKSELSELLKTKSVLEKAPDLTYEYKQDNPADYKGGSAEDSSPQCRSSKAFVPESQAEELIYSQYSSNGGMKLSLSESGLVDFDTLGALESNRDDSRGDRKSVNTGGNSKKRTDSVALMMKVIETPQDEDKSRVSKGN